MLRAYFLCALFALAQAVPQGDDGDNDHSKYSGTYAPWFQTVLAKYNLSEDTYYPGFDGVTLQTDTDFYFSCLEGYFITLDNLVVVVPNPENCDHTSCLDEQSCNDFRNSFTTISGLQLVVTENDEMENIVANMDADDEVIFYVHDHFYVDFYEDTVQAGSAYPEEEKK